MVNVRSDAPDDWSDAEPLVRYFQALVDWLDDATSDGNGLRTASEALSAEARRRQVGADGLLRTVKARLAGGVGRPEVARSADDLGRASRYVSAMEILLSAYFGDAQPRMSVGTPPVPPRNSMEQKARHVIDRERRAWRVFLVEEGMKWDPEIEMRRANWLCCAAFDEQRYISPVPPGWEAWSDDELLEAVAQAPRDHRGKR
jgi:hypothetical protein